MDILSALLLCVFLAVIGAWLLYGGFIFDLRNSYNNAGGMVMDCMRRVPCRSAPADANYTEQQGFVGYMALTYLVNAVFAFILCLVCFLQSKDSRSIGMFFGVWAGISLVLCLVVSTSASFSPKEDKTSIALMPFSFALMMFIFLFLFAFKTTDASKLSEFPPVVNYTRSESQNDATLAISNAIQLFSWVSISFFLFAGLVFSLHANPSVPLAHISQGMGAIFMVVTAGNVAISRVWSYDNSWGGRTVEMATVEDTIAGVSLGVLVVGGLFLVMINTSYRVGPGWSGMMAGHGVLNPTKTPEHRPSNASSVSNASVPVQMNPNPYGYQAVPTVNGQPGPYARPVSGRYPGT